MDYHDLISSLGYEVIYLFFGIRPAICSEVELRSFLHVIQLVEENKIERSTIDEILNENHEELERKEKLLLLLADV